MLYHSLSWIFMPVAFLHTITTQCPNTHWAAEDCGRRANPHIHEELYSRHMCFSHQTQVSWHVLCLKHTSATYFKTKVATSCVSTDEWSYVSVCPLSSCLLHFLIQNVFCEIHLLNQTALTNNRRDVNPVRNRQTLQNEAERVDCESTDKLGAQEHTFILSILDGV